VDQQLIVAIKNITTIANKPMAHKRNAPMLQGHGFLPCLVNLL